MSEKRPNVIIKDDTEYYVEYVWQTDKNKHDSKGVKYPSAKEGKAFGDKAKILSLLQIAHTALTDRKLYEKVDSSDCPICGKKNVERKKYQYIDYIWSDGIMHYIKDHNIDPSSTFRDFIYNRLFAQLEYDLTHPQKICPDLQQTRNRGHRRIESTKRDESKCVIKKPEPGDALRLARIRVNNEEYVKLEKNKLLILDALMISGGKFKKYVDPYNNKIKRYSEHAGFLDFDSGFLHKIVVSGQTDRVDDGDDEIFLPKDFNEMYDYEYIFHTHPPTPTPGGRAEVGILFEFPSIGDIFHFIDHYNEGNVIGSLVVAPEGLYNIRRYVDKTSTVIDLARAKTPKQTARAEEKIKKKMSEELDIDEDGLYEAYSRIFKRIQKDAIEEYGADFNTNEFYSVISQDTTYIDRFNKVLNRYEIQIDYFPRKQDGKYWYIDTVFLKFRQYGEESE